MNAAQWAAHFKAHRESGNVRWVHDEKERKRARFYGSTGIMSRLPREGSGVARILAERMGDSWGNVKKALQRLEAGREPRDGLLVAHLAHLYGMDVEAAVTAFSAGQRWPGADSFVRSALNRLEQYKADVSRPSVPNGVRDTAAGGVSRLPGERDIGLEPCVPSLEARDTESSTCPVQLEEGGES